VLALVVLELLNLRGMTGKAGAGDIVSECDPHGGMGIFVAIGTTLFQVIVGLPDVALAAGGEVVPRGGTVSRMAGEAGDRLVGCAVGSHIGRRTGMALDAVIHR